MQNKNQHLIQQSSTAVDLNSNSQAVLNEKQIIELIYQDKWENIQNCIVDGKFVDQYNNSVIEAKDNFEQLQRGVQLDDKDGFDQQNRADWFIPQEYKDMDIEKHILDLCSSEKELERVEYELQLFKSFAMLDVLKCLKYIVDTLRKKNIVWGVGRGSSVASYVLYLMGVHKVNSIQYNLDPTEFLR